MQQNKTGTRGMSGVSGFDRQTTRIASHARSSASQVRSLGRVTGGYLLPVVKPVSTCRPAQRSSGTQSALSVLWKKATPYEILRSFFGCNSGVKS